MNILYFVPYPPSLVRVRPYNLIRGLVKRGHKVTVPIISGGQGDQEEVLHLASLGIDVRAYEVPRWQSLWNSTLSLASTWPLQAVYSWNRSIAARISQDIARSAGSAFDIVHIEHLRGVRYGLFWKEVHPGQVVIWDSVDCISHLFRQAARSSRKWTSRIITRLELPRTERFEAFLPGRFDSTLVTSPVDRHAFIQLDSRSDPQRIHVIPNGVDLAYFSPAGADQRHSNRLIFSGKMSYHANVSMAFFLVEEILPRIWQKAPEMELWIVGKDPPSSVQALGSHPKVKVTGTVPDLRPYLQSAAVAIAPLTYGAGIQNKILEAMACSTPVVASSKAVQALQAVSGEHLLVADQPQEYADQVVRLVQEPQLRHQIGSAGRRYVEACHDWDQIVAALEQVYEGAISEKDRLLVDIRSSRR